MSARIEDSNGWWEIKDNPLSCVGVYEYLGESIDRDGALGLNPEETYSVYRPESELSDPDCIESFKLLPWINDHEMIGGDMTPAEDKGIQGIIGEDVYFDAEDKVLKGNIKNFSSDMEETIKSGKEELSCGYRCEYEVSTGDYMGKNYTIVQRAIRGNHLALVEEGRMGSQVAVLDKVEKFNFVFDATEAVKMEKDMEKTEDMEEAEDMEKAEDMEEDTEDGKEEDTEDEKAEDSEEEDTEEEDACDGGEAQELAAALKEVLPAMAKITDMMDKMSGDTEEKDGGYDMDSVTKQLKRLRTEVKQAVRKSKSNAQDSMKELMRVISKRDRLASRISAHTGTFDHAEMTLDEVARYGAKKLKLTCPKGQEIAALNGYLHNRKVVTASHGMDYKPNIPSLDDYIKGVK